MTMAVAKKKTEFHYYCRYDYRRPDCSLDPSTPQEQEGYHCQIATKNAAVAVVVVVQPG